MSAVGRRRISKEKSRAEAFAMPDRRGGQRREVSVSAAGKHVKEKKRLKSECPESICVHERMGIMGTVGFAAGKVLHITFAPVPTRAAEKTKVRAFTGERSRRMDEHNYKAGSGENGGDPCGIYDLEAFREPQKPVRQKPRRVTISFTEEEYAKLKDHTSKNGLSIQKYILRLIAGDHPKAVPSEELWDILGTLIRIEVAITERAVDADEFGFQDESEFWEAEKELQAKISEIKEMLRE